MFSICAIVVTYKPDRLYLTRLIDAITPQTSGQIIVDNASESDWLASLCADRSIPLLNLSHNMGLAAAQNKGIDWARQAGYSHVLLLDQDSEPSQGMVGALVQAETMLKAEGIPVAVVGPRYLDRNHGNPVPFVRIRAHRIQRYFSPPDRNRPYIRTDFVIASGSLIALQVLSQIGDMRESFFIDNIDIEWCYRAQAQGLHCYGVFSAHMLHSIGENSLPMFGGRRQQPIHSPQRLYYMMRNRLILYQLPHVPIHWMIQDIPRLILKFMLFALIIQPRAKNASSMLRGLRDGLRGREGKFEI